jgi:hypothetical protein
VLLVKGKIPQKILEHCTVHSFDEEFESYMRKEKKKNWRSLEGFSLDFDSSIDDLKVCQYVFPDNEKTKAWILKNLNVIEEV